MPVRSDRERESWGQPLPASMHGEASSYCNFGCRCALCRAAWAEYMTDLRKRRLARPIPVYVQHGKASTYSGWGCRCDDCRAAASERRRRERRKRA